MRQKDHVEDNEWRHGEKDSVSSAGGSVTGTGKVRDRPL